MILNLSGRHQATLWGPIVTNLNSKTNWIWEQTHHDFLRCAFFLVEVLQVYILLNVTPSLCGLGDGWSTCTNNSADSGSPSQRASGNARRPASWIICVSDTVLDCMSFFFDSPEKQLDNFCLSTYSDTLVRLFGAIWVIFLWLKLTIFGLHDVFNW